MSEVHIDGSYGEGGGQVLRTSLSLAALLGRDLTLDNIRAGRGRPGLAAQHVTCVRAAAAICGAQVTGDAVDSQRLTFRPGELRPGHFRFDVSDVKASAGAVSLVLQTVLLPLLFSGGESVLALRGGTNVPWSPPFEYLAQVFLPALARMGVTASVRRERGGWYPRGGGEITATILPLGGPLKPLQMPRPGALRRLTVTSTVSAGLPEHIARRQAEAALQALPEGLGARPAGAGPGASAGPWTERAEERPEGGPGTCLALAAELQTGHAGASALGERGKPAEQVGREAAAQLAAWWRTGAAVDLRLADQLLPYLALAEGHSEVLAEARTRHLTTNAWVVEQFLPVAVALEGDSPVVVRVEGVGGHPARGLV